jgi:transposase
MLRYFKNHKEDFMKHYHKRSNVETVFSMVKRKFGSHVRSKYSIAQENEVLCKALCHNIVVLIH